MNNPIGVSTWVWASPLDDATLTRLIDQVADIGFDVIELPIEGLDDWDPTRTAARLQDRGLAATVCAVMTPDRDLTTADPRRAEATIAYLRACIDAAAVVGSPVVAGPMYAPVGLLVRMTPAERGAVIARLVERLAGLADHAATRRVRLALEPLNRFETSFVNTVDQALEIVEAVASPALGVCLDTFHMNIEEKDPVTAVQRAGRHVAHVQACGTDRGSPGQDRFDWPGFVAALRAVGYEGPVCIESFTSDNEAIATAAAIWRPLAPSQDQLAEDGLRHLRSLIADTAAPAVRAT